MNLTLGALIDELQFGVLNPDPGRTILSDEAVENLVLITDFLQSTCERRRVQQTEPSECVKVVDFISATILPPHVFAHNDSSGGMPRLIT